MTFELSEYKLKHIVSLEDGIIDSTRFEIPVEGQYYNFKIDRTLSEQIELIAFFKYGEIQLASGPLEQKLKNFTFGKSYQQLQKHELYNIKFSKFHAKIEDKTYEFQITGAGPTALKVSLFLIYKEIEKEETSLEIELKQLILNRYGSIINNNITYQKKLVGLQEDYERSEAKREKILDEIRKEEKEKERKRRELEELLNSNKPKNNDRPFKMY